MRAVHLVEWASISANGLNDPTPATEPTITDFEIRKALGRKGTRSMDRVTALAVFTIDALIDRLGADAPDHATAVVLGTTAGSVSSTIGFTYDSVTQDRPYLVDPARFPNTVMNCPAGRSAIWHGLRGPNATVAGGAHAMSLALNYARRLLLAGRARDVIVGAAEEYSPERAALQQATGSTSPTSEGAAMFLMRATTAARSLALTGPLESAPAVGDTGGAPAVYIDRVGGPVFHAESVSGGDCGAAAGALTVAAAFHSLDHTPSSPASTGLSLTAIDSARVSRLPLEMHAGVR